tara:strand:- start:1155 stop:1499 length:345 start_codon:yes stop_codon:yes gene_type:complete
VSKNLDKLKGHSDRKQDINRRNGDGLTGKDAIRLNKRIDDLKRVISDPDVWNANISSRERLDEIEKKLLDLIARVNGIGYLVRGMALNKRIDDEEIKNNLDRIDNDTSVSGSVE